jgi:hypothetical protein
MKNKNQLFSRSYEINFTDYNREKKALTILRAVKKEDPNTTIKYFFSYSDFIIITKAYFQFLKRTKCLYLKPPVSLLQTNTARIVYNELEAHINQCQFCRDPKNLCTFDCESVKQILYPYGKCLTTQDDCDNMYFPAPIDMSKWCVDPICPSLESNEVKFKSKDNKEATNRCDCIKLGSLFV